MRSSRSMRSTSSTAFSSPSPATDMPHIHSEDRVITFKIVYYGPGMSGKTTNLCFIHRSISENVRGDLITLDTAEERTLFFDFFPLALGTIEGYSVRFNMYTVPGQVYYEASRRLILDGADGVVFVADSQAQRLEENLVGSHDGGQPPSYGRRPEQVPIVLQYNKRDFAHPLPWACWSGSSGSTGACRRSRPWPPGHGRHGNDSRRKPNRDRGLPHLIRRPAVVRREVGVQGCLSRAHSQTWES